MAAGARHVASKLVRRMAGVGPVGRSLSHALYAAGLTAWSRRLSQYSKYVPPEVVVEVVDRTGAARQIRFDSLSGGDQVVATVWRRGFNGYECPLPEVYAATVRLTAGAILDVGANSGFYAIVAATIDDPERVHAFEPFPPAYQCLERNRDLNGPGVRFRMNASAVGVGVGEAKLYVPQPVGRSMATLETSASLRPDFRPKHQRVLNVPVTTIDAYAHDALNGPVGLIRIDAEGHEASVLEGGGRTLASDRPILFVEVLAKGTLAEEIDQVRRSAGYRVAWMDERQLTECPTVRPYRLHFNQVLFPEESGDLIRRIAGTAGLGWLPLASE